MQNRVIVLGGLETGYMRKLALYLSSRLKGQAQVRIVEKDPESGNGQTVWVGSRNFIEKMKEREKNSCFIILSEEDSCEENCLCRYQSCEKIYQQIMTCCQRMYCIPAMQTGRQKQRWVVMTTDCGSSALLAFSITFAYLLREKGSVLYLNFSECCGMEALFAMEKGTDLSDLILALRKEQNVCMDSYIRKLEGMDCILPPDNPMILHEIREADVHMLLQNIWETTRYDYVVVALGCTCCGCEYFFQAAQTLFHLVRQEASSDACRQAWRNFIRMCMEEKKISLEEVSFPKVFMESRGVHLLYEWVTGPLGMIAERYLDQGGDELG